MIELKFSLIQKLSLPCSRQIRYIIICIFVKKNDSQYSVYRMGWLFGFANLDYFIYDEASQQTKNR